MMSKIEVYCLDNTERTEIESLDRGHRHDIYVRVDESLYNLSIYNITRLKQDFETEFEYHGFYHSESNIVLVETVDKECILKTIEYIYRGKYFTKVKPLSTHEANQLDLKRYELELH